MTTKTPPLTEAQKRAVAYLPADRSWSSGGRYWRTCRKMAYAPPIERLVILRVNETTFNIEARLTPAGLAVKREMGL